MEHDRAGGAGDQSWHQDEPDSGLAHRERHPRRRINLDEALAFARVFELPLEELMSPPLEGLDIASRRLVQEAVEAFYETRDARDRLHHAVVAIADHIKAHPDSSRAIHEQCLRLMGDERDARTLSNDIADGGHY